ncbi:unnamed protein product [Calypogeia fissa]
MKGGSGKEGWEEGGLEATIPMYSMFTGMRFRLLVVPAGINGGRLAGSKDSLDDGSSLVSHSRIAFTQAAPVPSHEVRTREPQATLDSYYYSSQPPREYKALDDELPAREGRSARVPSGVKKHSV